jgi:predicted phage terminase large subunit-like protein
MKNKPVSTAKLDLSKVKLPSLEEVMIALDRLKCKDSLAEFVKRAWHLIEPATPLVWGQVLDVMCKELEQIFFDPGFQPRLLMNVPPGTMKSILVSVMFPAWVWTIKPSESFTGAAHEQGLAIRDARKMRIIVESDWYQARWPLKLSIDANAKTLFENEKRGFRQAMPFGSLTGRRSNYVLIDDPLSAEDANSEAAIKEAERIFRETLPTRINNDQSAIIVIMQRLAQSDTSGLILEHKTNYGYKTLILPMRFEADRADPKDWRTVDGELLFPERYSERAVSALEEILGPYGAAGQLQQRPQPRDGGLFNRAWFKTLDAMPNDLTLCRGWDLAATTNQTSAFTAGVLMGISRDGKIVICDLVHGRWTPDGVYTVVNQAAQSDGTHVRQSISKDPGQAGIAQVNQFSKNLAGYDVRFSPESGDKILRALPLSAQVESGNVYLLKGDWNKAFLDELCMFPGSKYKDITDASSRAYAELLKMTKPNGATVSCFAPMIV